MTRRVAKVAGDILLNAPVKLKRNKAKKQFRKLCKAAGVVFNKHHRSALQRRIQRYAADRAIWQSAARPTEVIKILDQVEKLAGQLVDLLDASGSSTAARAARTALRNNLAEIALMQGIPGGVSIGDFRLRLGCIQHAARRSIQQIPPATSRPPEDPFREAFLRDLSDLFDAAGGVGKLSNDGGDISGHLYDFVKAASEIAGVPTTKLGGIRHLLSLIPRSR